MGKSRARAVSPNLRCVPSGSTGATGVRAAYDAETITAVALRVFQEQGYDGTSMADLAAAAGVTKAAFYHHVGNKEELLSRGLDQALDALFAMLDEPDATSGSALSQIRYILRRMVELEDSLLPQVTVLLRARGNSDSERKAVARRRSFDRHVARLVAEAQREGEVRADLDPQLISRLAIGMSTWIIEWYQPGGKLSVADVADAVVTMICDGMAVVRDEAFNSGGQGKHAKTSSTRREQAPLKKPKTPSR
jgi:AcrR family transcriptional regulator